MTMTASQRAMHWIEHSEVDTAMKNRVADLFAIGGATLESHFGSHITFGTGGMRGEVGVGSNRINKYTIVRMTKALANYIKRCDSERRGVVVGFDNRTDSSTFALLVTALLAQEGIKAYIFNDMRPTPMLSYAIRALNAMAGVMITASHNPRQYNGYKVYWEDGSQITEPIANELIKERDGLPEIVRIPDDESVVETGSLAVGIRAEEFDELYMSEMDRYMKPFVVDRNGTDPMTAIRQNTRVMYTALSGVGSKIVPKALERYGYQPILVEGQCEPDPLFRSSGNPNPESSGAFTRAIRQTFDMREKPHLILATDPDCDRVGAAVWNATNNNYRILNGNNMAALMLNYIYHTRAIANAYLVTTMVSGGLPQKIAQYYGHEVVETPTGFKYIGETIRRRQYAGQGNFFFGYEESMGFLLGDFVRDKDGILSATYFADVVAYFNQEQYGGVLNVLNGLHETHGFHKENTETLSFEPDRIAEIMNYMSSCGVDGMNVVVDSDNFVKLRGSRRNEWVAFRPSGTETSRLKIYFGVVGGTLQEAGDHMSDLKDKIFDAMEGGGYL